MVRLALVLALALCAPGGAAAQAPGATGRVVPDASLSALSFLTGRWEVPRDAPDVPPEVRDLVILEVLPTLGGHALAYREHVWADGPDGAELEGMIYWDPALEQIRFHAVGGRAEGQGRLFVGEYTPLEDGRIQKIYDVFYRTLADIPAEDLGGMRRRFREVWEPDGPDRLVHTLEWWLDGRWQPFNRGRYVLARVGAGGAGSS